MNRQEQISEWLSLFVGPEQWTELRALNVQGRKAVHRFFLGSDALALAEQALEWENEGASGVYFVPNPIDQATTRSGKFTADADVASRRWLLVDIDAKRPPNTSASEEERAKSWAVVQRVLGILAGIKGKYVLADSGNGFHVLLPAAWPNDVLSKEAARDFLDDLDERCGDSFARVDHSTYNAARITKLYGTIARKGQPTAARPHRYSRILEI